MFSSKRIRVEILESLDTPVLSSINMNYVPQNLKSILQTNQNTSMIFDDFRVDAVIKKVASTIGPTATIKIYGVSKQNMDAITSVLIKQINYTQNKRVRLSVDNGNGYITLFEGCIQEAVPVYQAVPDCYIQIESSMAAFENAMKLPPISFADKSVAISSMLKTLCSAYGMECYTSDGINSSLPVKPIRLSSENAGIGARIVELCEAYGLKSIRVTNGYRFFLKNESSQYEWLFTPNTMEGYPTYRNRMISVSTDDFIGIEVNDRFRVSGSEVSFANSLWYITMIKYNLQSRAPNGKWEATVIGAPVGEII